jgi:hypothetical protein
LDDLQTSFRQRGSGVKRHEFVKVKRGRGFSKKCGACGFQEDSKVHSATTIITMGAAPSVSHIAATLEAADRGLSTPPTALQAAYRNLSALPSHIAATLEAADRNDVPTMQDLDLGGLTAYEGGATRSVKVERRELIPASAITSLARRLALGAAKHGVNNWRKGGEGFRLATLNHLLDHIFEYMERGGQENVDAIICNAAFLCEFEAREAYKGVV